MNLRKIMGLVIIMFILSLTAIAQDETMTNAEVTDLVNAGLNKSIIINKIRNSKTNFDLSTDALINLKKAGFDDDIVNAMLEAKNGKSTDESNGTSAEKAIGDPNDPMSPHGYGIYLYEERNNQKKMTQLSPNVSAQNRTGGKVTAAITPFGLGKVKTKANLAGRNATLKTTNPKPVFYFYLDKSSGGLNTSSGIPSSPNEFVLIKFNVRSDNREITIAKSNDWGAKGGLSDESVKGFDAEDLGNGIFRVTPKSKLKKGEYAFYMVSSGGSNTASGVGAKFFDFGVKRSKP